jgi:hypothetical protein
MTRTYRFEMVDPKSYCRACANLARDELCPLPYCEVHGYLIPNLMCFHYKPRLKPKEVIMPEENDRQPRDNARKILRTAFEVSTRSDQSQDPEVRYLRGAIALALRELNGGN